jgi:UDP-N-acetylmuramate--alanine ligase
LNSAGANARLGSGDCIVVEADESDASFLHLSPVLAVVTNIDADHMETYGHDFNQLKAAFVSFLNRMPFYGTAVLCTDDAAVREIVPQLRSSVVSYGFDEGAQLRAVDVQAVGAQMKFTVQRRPAKAGDAAAPDLSVVLNLAGRHNVLNALAAIAVAQKLGVSDAAMQAALANFQGVGRRFQSYGEVRAESGGSFTLMEDYGHHPVEIAATLAAARGAFAGRRLLLAFQPHRYTRTRDCFDAFVTVLGQADKLLLAPVYAAGEAPIAGADAASLARAVSSAGKVEPVFVDDIAAMAQAITQHARAGDVVLCMGAGSIGAVPPRVLALMQSDAAQKTKGVAQ